MPWTALVTAIEARERSPENLSGSRLSIESAAGITNVAEIAAASPRLTAMSLGAADFAASMGMATTGIGGTQENYYMLREGAQYWSDPWHWVAIGNRCRVPRQWRAAQSMAPSAISAMMTAFARRPGPGPPPPPPPFGHIGHGRQMGDPPQGKWRLPTRYSPRQRPPWQRRAKSLMRWNRPKARGEGATVYKGRLVDIASIKQAEVIVRQAEMIAA